MESFHVSNKNRKFIVLPMIILLIWDFGKDYDNITEFVTSVEAIYLIVGFICGIGTIYLLSKWEK